MMNKESILGICRMNLEEVLVMSLDLFVVSLVQLQGVHFELFQIQLLQRIRKRNEE